MPAFVILERHAPPGPIPTRFGDGDLWPGCFWGAEQIFWQLPGVYSTAVGYAGGYTPNPTYEAALSRAGLGAFTTGIAPTGPFYFAEPYHQQYLHKKSVSGTRRGPPDQHNREVQRYWLIWAT